MMKLRQERTRTAAPGRKRFRQLAQGLFLSAALTAAGTAAASEISARQAESRVFAQVVVSALEDAMGDTVRVSQSAAHYLPDQGLFVQLRLSRRWSAALAGESGQGTIRINGEITDWRAMPTLVLDILSELDINVAPREPEALETLRQLRQEQRDLREAERDVRAELRSTRRELAAAADTAERRTLESRIGTLEQNLAGITENYDALAADVERQYERLDSLQEAETASLQQAVAPALEETLSDVLCRYGRTLASLPASDYVTLALEQGNRTDYQRYSLAALRRCVEEGDPAQLASSALTYSDAPEAASPR